MLPICAAHRSDARPSRTTTSNTFPDRSGRNVTVLTQSGWAGARVWYQCFSVTPCGKRCNVTGCPLTWGRRTSATSR